VLDRLNKVQGKSFDSQSDVLVCRQIPRGVVKSPKHSSTIITMLQSHGATQLQSALTLLVHNPHQIDAIKPLVPWGRIYTRIDHISTFLHLHRSKIPQKQSNETQKERNHTAVQLHLAIMLHMIALVQVVTYMSESNSNEKYIDHRLVLIMTCSNTNVKCAAFLFLLTYSSVGLVQSIIQQCRLYI
jgi:hypothetical protein